MKELTTYIKENSFTIEQYLMNEGLISWIKKIWSWMFDDIKDNVKSHNGNYVNSDEIIDSASSSKDLKNISFIFAKIKDKKEFDKLIKAMNSENKNGAFYNAYKFYKENPESVIYSCLQKIGDMKQLIAFQFCEQPEEDKIKRTQTCFSSSIIDNKPSSEFLSHFIKTFTIFIKKTENLDVFTTR